MPEVSTLPAALLNEVPVVHPPAPEQAMSPSSIKRVARRLFLQRHPGPTWVCVFCEGVIAKMGRESDSLVVHHKNEDHHDNRDENHGPSHYGCHSSHHQKKRRAQWVS